MADFGIIEPETIDDAVDPADVHNRARQRLLGGAHPHEYFGKAAKQQGDAEEQFESNYIALMKHYEAAHPYKDALLEVIIELYDDLGKTVGELSRIRPPAFCGDEGVRDCAASLRAAKRDFLASSIALYRKKAAFVDHVERQLDEIDDPRAKGYMTCRVAIAAKLDHDLTPEAMQPGPRRASGGAAGFSGRRRRWDGLIGQIRSGCGRCGGRESHAALTGRQAGPLPRSGPGPRGEPPWGRRCGPGCRPKGSATCGWRVSQRPHDPPGHSRGACPRG